jgi:valyl-tRNA synthetase
VNEALEAYRFDEAAAAIYHFAWHEVFDWYLELIKPELAAGGPGAEAARATLSHTMDRLLRLLHPFMPFLTEELWQAMPREAGDPLSVALAPFPERETALEDEEAERRIGTLMENVTAVRNLRAASGIPPATRVAVHLRPLDARSSEDLGALRDRIATLTRAASVELGPAPAAGSVVRAVTTTAEIALPLEGVVDVSSEKARLSREIDRLERELAQHAAKLGNDQFVARAKPEAIEKVRGAHREVSDRLGRLKETLSRLGP